MQVYRFGILLAQKEDRDCHYSKIEGKEKEDGPYFVLPLTNKPSSCCFRIF